MAATILFAALALPSLAGAATPARIVYGSLVRRGPVTELRFIVQGRAPRLALSAHGTELWIDLAGTRVDIPPRPFFGRESAPVAMVRAMNRGAMGSRIVVEVSGRTDYAIARLPHEILLRLAPAGEVANLAAPILLRTSKQGVATPGNAAPLVRASRAVARASPIGSRPAAEMSSADPAFVRPPEPELSRAPLADNPLVMIDPGHGGYDPGTHSASGTDEKTLALEIARRVKSALEARGVRAELTRTGDYFVSLPQRTRLANQAGAKLFVSIHLNSSPDTATSGLEVFYLNNTTDRATIRLARMENQGVANGYGPVTDAGLNYILADLRQSYKATESAALARMIDAEAVADLDEHLGIKVHALGARKGPFYVLVGANMPAVLVECGFLTNPAEAARLASARYQQILADGIAGAIVHFLSADAAVGNL
jgi:N-acetylmuramoyl-L-alanine amidase